MNRLGIFAALTGFLAVALGAFGAHALDDQLTPEGLDWWHTATLYALPHAAAALACARALWECGGERGKGLAWGRRRRRRI